MAQRRMFAKSVIGAGRFLMMPCSTRLLYYDLGMHADDDGIVEAVTVMRSTGATEDDLRVLATKGYVTILNEDLVTHITDWNRNNQLRKDRYTPSIYASLLVKITGENQAETARQPNGNQMEPQYRLGKVSLNISGDDADTCARASAEEQVKQFVIERNSDPRQYFGVDDAVEDEAYAFTSALFQQWTRRLPTESDVANVFESIKHTEQIDGKWVTTFPKDAKDLLMYAFEQSVMAGAAGDWFYIRGVLTNLKQRGITNLEQAEQYDAERDMRKDGVWNG